MQVLVTERPNKSRRVALDFSGGVSRTKQADKKSADVNEIMRKYREKGILPVLPNATPRYGDFTGASDFHTMMQRVVAARQDFDSLPSDLRKRFGNDPGQLLDFLANPDNNAEAIKLGLKPKPALPPRKDAQGNDVPRSPAEGGPAAPAPAPAPVGG